MRKWGRKNKSAADGEFKPRADPRAFAPCSDSMVWRKQRDEAASWIRFKAECRHSSRVRCGVWGTSRAEHGSWCSDSNRRLLFGNSWNNRHCSVSVRKRDVITQTFKSLSFRKVFCVYECREIIWSILVQLLTNLTGNIWNCSKRLGTNVAQVKNIRK